MNIGIVEPEGFSEKVIKFLSEENTVERLVGNEGDLAKFIVDKEAIFVRLRSYWGKKILEKAPKLKYLCTPTTGLNHIDLNYCLERNIYVVSLKGEADFLTRNIKATPEHTFGLLISLLRWYNRAFLSLANRDNDRDHYKGREIFEKNVGIIGMGRVGTVLAGYLRAFGANILYYDNAKVTSEHTECSSMFDLISKSDIVFLTASYSVENKRMINRKLIDLMRDKYFINTARGELVDEAYLIEKIAGDHFAGVAIDVISNEHHKNNLNKFIDLTAGHNLIITPHISGVTFESMAKTEEFIARKLLKIESNDLLG